MVPWQRCSVDSRQFCLFSTPALSKLHWSKEDHLAPMRLMITLMSGISLHWDNNAHIFGIYFCWRIQVSPSFLSLLLSKMPPQWQRLHGEGCGRQLKGSSRWFYQGEREGEAEITKLWCSSTDSLTICWEEQPATCGLPDYSYESYCVIQKQKRTDNIEPSLLESKWSLHLPVFTWIHLPNVVQKELLWITLSRAPLTSINS